MDTIRFYRRLRDKEQKDLAELLGITTSAISRIEQGKAEISARNLLKIATYLQIPIEKFFLPIPNVDALLANGQEHPHG